MIMKGSNRHSMIQFFDYISGPVPYKLNRIASVLQLKKEKERNKIEKGMKGKKENRKRGGRKRKKKEKGIEGKERKGKKKRK